ncbi:MAG: clostripain-related cysteine peptidase [bacterium]
MFKKCLAGFGAAAFIASAAVAGDVNFDQNLNLGDAIKAAAAEVSVPAVFPEKPLSKKITVLVYVNAKNNLESAGLKDLNEMEIVGSDDNMNVVVELGRIKGYSTADGDWTGSRRYLIQKDADMNTITSPVVQEIAKADMGDYKHLVEFTKWGQTNYPAERYMLIVWNHGSGWKKTREDFSVRGISYDDETGNHITTAQLGKAMAEIGKIDVYSSDACLMQMVEVGYEIKDFADVLVQSEETEPGDGYDYTGLLARIAAKPDASAEEVGKFAVDAYIEFYAKKNMPVAQSAVKGSALAGLNNLLGEWTEMVMAANETALIKSVKTSAQAFYYRDNKDLYHIVQLNTKGTTVPELAQKGKELMEFMDSQLFVANGVFGSKYANAHGIAIYAPNYSVSSAYDQLTWSKESKWDEFAKWFANIR